LPAALVFKRPDIVRVESEGPVSPPGTAPGAPVYRHKLKSWPPAFTAALKGAKRFEMRKDDRDPGFASGDLVELCEFDPVGPDGTPRGYTGRRALFFVGYIERSPALPDGWCGFELVSFEDFEHARPVFTKVGR